MTCSKMVLALTGHQDAADMGLQTCELSSYCRSNYMEGRLDPKRTGLVRQRQDGSFLHHVRDNTL